VPRRGCIDVLLIFCPHCGARDQTEFAYGGDASVVRPAADAPLEAWFAYVYLRDNPAGQHAEYWQHVAGCRRWIRIRRDTVTHEIT
jgi:heterotetrameric sarcosine oxidase delta subunit